MRQNKNWEHVPKKKSEEDGEAISEVRGSFAT